MLICEGTVWGQGFDSCVFVFEVNTGLGNSPSELSDPEKLYSKFSSECMEGPWTNIELSNWYIVLITVQ